MIGQSGSFGRTRRVSLERHESQVRPSLCSRLQQISSKGIYLLKSLLAEDMAGAAQH